jgi:hypothetical protein
MREHITIERGLIASIKSSAIGRYPGDLTQEVWLDVDAMRLVGVEQIGRDYTPADAWYTPHVLVGRYCGKVTRAQLIEDARQALADHKRFEEA